MIFTLLPFCDGVERNFTFFRNEIFGEKNVIDIEFWIRRSSEDGSTEFLIEVLIEVAAESITFLKGDMFK
ncbi:hypothetical protein [Bacillus sp. P14.5]|uniref:hypothetical protein n=1 Tax=Bacillus sp. P14.5 TaxID=1983400 RepID=UPI000DE8E54E|nr:hypothetical protein [Bacillus sp. P14.5]